MTPNIKCLCLFGNPEIGLADNCPIHGKKITINSLQKELAEKEKEITKLRKEVSELTEICKYCGKPISQHERSLTGHTICYPIK